MTIETIPQYLVLVIYLNTLGMVFLMKSPPVPYSVVYSFAAYSIISFFLLQYEVR